MAGQKRAGFEGIDVNIGIVGLGYWGKNILRDLYELRKVHTACDVDPEILKERKKDFPDIKYTRNLEDILSNPAIKAVVISTPAVTHYGLAKAALNAEKDVFVEKPLALNTEDGSELSDLARRKERILMVGHILQYHPAVAKLKELILNKELGDIQYIYSNRLNIGKLRFEENILWSFASHDISAILMLTDDEPAKVSCFGGDYLNKGVYDVTLTTLEFKNEIKAHIFVSWLHPFKEQKLIVVGSKAMAVFDDLTREKLFLYPHKIEWKNGKIPVARRAERYTAKIEHKQPLKEELLHFINCVKERKKPKTDAYEALRVLKVLEAAGNSIQNKGLEVNLRHEAPV